MNTSRPASRTVTREELYTEIWRRPVRTVAGELGITGTALAKICKKLDVPRPSLGYWARLQHGQSPPRTPLPPRADRVPSEVEIRPSSSRPRGEAGAATPAALPRVTPSPDLRRPHPAVAKIRQVVKAERAQADGTRVVPSKGETVLRIGEAALERGLLIFDALFRTLDERGHRVVLTTLANEYFTSYALEAHIDNVKIPLTLIERVSRRDHVLTVDELAAKARRSYLPAPRYDFACTGRLTLRIGGRHGVAHREWTDGARRRLESMLGEVVLALEEGAEALRVYAREVEEAKRQRALEVRHELHERALREELAHVVAAWAEAKQIRAFLEDLEARVPAELRGQERFDAWVRWVRGRADAVDSICKPEKLAKAVEPLEPAWGGCGS